MLGVILGILKIIGITLLVILLIIIALLLIVLFVPIRYKAHGTIEHCDLDDENLDFKEKIKADAGFTWLLHLVRGGIGYPEHKEFWLKVLFFKILPKSEDAKRKKEEKQIKKDRKKSHKKLEQAMENASEAEEIGPLDRDGVGAESEAGSEGENSEGKNSTDGSNAEEGSNAKDGLNSEDSSNAGNGANSEDGSNGAGAENAEDAEDSGSEGLSEGKGCKNGDSEVDGSAVESQDLESEDVDVDIFTFFDFLEKLVDLFWGTIDFLEKPENAVEKAFYTISKACDKIDLIQDTLESPTFERAYRCARKDLFLILRHVMPKKVSADILLGLGDPATTAQVLAAVNVASAFIDYDIELEPDFDNKVVEADMDIKGRIALWRLVLSAARVYFNKDIRKVWKRINRIISK